MNELNLGCGSLFIARQDKVTLLASLEFKPCKDRVDEMRGAVYLHLKLKARIYKIMIYENDRL